MFLDIELDVVVGLVEVLDVDFLFLFSLSSGFLFGTLFSSRLGSLLCRSFLVL